MTPNEVLRWVPLLRNWRRQPVQPHRLAAALREQLLALEELFRAVGDTLDDDRWRIASRHLHDAAEAVRRCL